MSSFHLKNISDYNTAYEASVKNTEQFLKLLQKNKFLWKKPWNRVLEYDFSVPKIKWFEGAELNITEKLYRSSFGK